MGGGGFIMASRLLLLRGLRKVLSRRAVRDTWGCATHNRVKKKRTSATGAFVMARVATGAEINSSGVMVIIIFFFNCHEEWLW